jgi:hypothetical protein
MPNVWPDTHPHFPWYPRQASFFMVDSKIAQQFVQHAKHHGGEDNCVFCRQLAAKNVNAIAVVNLVDAEGKTLPIDLQKLIDLKEKQTVTIHGRARLLAGSLLQIDADGIYLNQPATATVAHWIITEVAKADNAHQAATVAHVEELRAEIRALQQQMAERTVEERTPSVPDVRTPSVPPVPSGTG